MFMLDMVFGDNVSRYDYLSYGVTFVRGGCPHPLGERIRNTLATVGATWSTVTGVSTLDASKLVPMKKRGKVT